MEGFFGWTKQTWTPTKIIAWGNCHNALHLSQFGSVVEIKK